MTMVWSNLKKQFELMLAPALRGRLQVHVTAYDNTNAMDVGRGWVTLDGKEVVSVQIPSFYSNNIGFTPETLDFGQALHQYLNFSVQQALGSSDALVSGFAYLDRRVGRRTLQSVDVGKLHEFAQILYKVRCAAEGIER